MRNKNLLTTLSAGGRILLALLFVFSQSAWAVDASKPAGQAGAGGAAPAAKAQANAPPSPAAPTSPSHNAEVKENAPKGGQHEGIKVHGHWTIEVRNPDGKVVAHREFENSLASGGAPLPYILSRTNSIGLWVILLGPGSGPYTGAGLCPGSTTGGDCELVEAADPSTGSGVFKTLVPSAPNAFAFVLTGTVTAGTSGTVSTVQTIVGVCGYGASSPCAPGTSDGGVGASGQLFTQAILSPGVTVSTGQTIAVTVNFSFS